MRDYVAFLNAVAADDPNGLFHEGAGPGYGITRTGAPGSYRLCRRRREARTPVNFVTFWDAARFANWLHNGQPSGAQTAATTEDGAYTITTAGVNNNIDHAQRGRADLPAQ